MNFHKPLTDEQLAEIERGGGWNIPDSAALLVRAVPMILDLRGLLQEFLTDWLPSLSASLSKHGDVAALEEFARRVREAAPIPLDPRDARIAELSSALRSLTGKMDADGVWCWCPDRLPLPNERHHARCLAARAALKGSGR